MPDSVNLCIRPRDLGRPCLGRVWTPQPGRYYCERCGGTEPGAVYVRADAGALPPTKDAGAGFAACTPCRGEGGTA